MRKNRDYAKKRFIRPRRFRRHYGRYFWATGGVCLALVAALNLPTVVAHLPIATIAVTGVRLAAADQVVQSVAAQLNERRWWLLPQRVAVFFNTSQAERRLRQLYPFAHWSVRRTWLGGLRIQADERAAQLVWVSASGNWFLDSQGDILTPLAMDSAKAMGTGPAVIRRFFNFDRSMPVVAEELGPGETASPPPLGETVVRFIREVAAALQPGGSLGWTETVSGFRYHPPSLKLTVETTGNREVYFAADQPWSEQLAKLRAVVADGVLERPGLRYLDVRFGQKVFYQ